jgi:type VI secretion system Hcp family effector
MAAYIKFDGIDGAVSHKEYDKWIEVSNFSYGIHKSGASGVGTKRNEGTNIFADLSIKKLVDKASAKILEKMCGQDRYKEVKIVVLVSAGGKEQAQLEITLTDVMVTSYQLDGAEQSTALESLSLNYTTIKQKVYGFDSKGTRDSGAEFAYNCDTRSNA